MSGGSGWLEQLLEHWPAAVEHTLAQVEECPSACDTLYAPENVSDFSMNIRVLMASGDH